MPRPQIIDDDTLIERLSHTFRSVGYEGASLSRLAAAAGMQKPSLYHRFPGGKQQMAEEVLAVARGWFFEHVLAPLTATETKAKRLAQVSEALDQFYDGGRHACLLNLLSQPPSEHSPFAKAINDMFSALIDAFTVFAGETGMSPQEAQRRATRTVALLHGSLVLSRGLNSSAPFKAFTASLPQELGVEP
jgi:TetR/AcrR family transcriptional regulator, lmrAB and yxaGH operons repressor